ncbi:hypothetical protein ANCCAN_27319 [Ancylostoma caninum]|uniref:Uncharacterized protein n=1 Tax=Ancylostoma caninum TaxID=29170 RepID=A0A368F4E6_ANCCA|nr:hypothetical protein ANCCAN_27319 [Ancylostoma caninum]
MSKLCAVMSGFPLSRGTLSSAEEFLEQLSLDPVEHLSNAFSPNGFLDVLHYKRSSHILSRVRV